VKNNTGKAMCLELNGIDLFIGREGGRPEEKISHIKGDAE